MKTKDAIKWANALRSGKFKQTTSRLQGENGFCCLGVACKIFIPRDKQKLHKRKLEGFFPDNQRYSPKWLKGINNDSSNLLGRKLSMLNDLDNYSFDEIADVIELLYVHKAIK